MDTMLFGAVMEEDTGFINSYYQSALHTYRLVGPPPHNYNFIIWINLEEKIDKGSF